MFSTMYQNTVEYLIVDYYKIKANLKSPFFGSKILKKNVAFHLVESI